MTQLVHGEFRGLTWYEIPAAACGHDRRHIPEGVDTVTVIAPLGQFPFPSVEQAMLTNPEKVTLASQAIAFKPFEDGAMPGRVVMYNRHDFTSANVTEWAHANLDIPDTLDLSFEYEPGRYALSVVASTVQNGSAVQVRRKLDTDVTMAEALARHMPFLLSKCRRPVGPVAEFSCSAYTAGILSTITRIGAVQLEDWLERLRQKNMMGMHNLVLPGEVFHGGLVTRITMHKAPSSNIIRSSVTMTGGHTLEDDDTGVEIRIEALVPETVRQQLRGRPLSDLIDADWARGMRIRTVREKGDRDGQISLRAFGENVPLPAPEARDWSDEEAERHIREAGEGEYPQWQLVQEAAIPILRRLTRQQLASVTSLLAVHGQIDLAQFDQPGWILRGRGRELVIESCPAVPYADFLALALGEWKPDCDARSSLRFRMECGTIHH